MAAPAIGRRPRWSPPVSAQVDREHPLSQGLIRHWDLATFHERCGSGDRWRNTRNNADTGRYPTPWGAGFQRGADGSGSAIFSSTVALPIGANSLTVITTYAGFGSNPNFETVAGPAAGASLLRTRNAGIGPTLQYSSTNTRFEFGADGAGLLVGARSTTGRTLGQWYMVGGTYEHAANSFRVYVDGRLEGTDNFTVAGPFGGTWGSEIAHAQTPGTNLCADKRMGFIAVWTRCLSSAEMVQVYADPFQMLRS